MSGWSVDERLRAALGAGPVHCFGFSWRKRRYLQRFLGDRRVQVVQDLKSLAVDAPLLVWGALPIGNHKGPVVRVEDGFLRSVGLGADLVAPSSWVFDTRGIYFDPACPSDLETLLANAALDGPLLARADKLRNRIVESGVTKYNLAGRAWTRPSGEKQVVLVVGQVENDASVQRGCTDVRTNAAIVARARQARPEAHLVYKPHPDVVAGLRYEGDEEQQARQLADEVVLHAPIEALLNAADEVHVMTSLAGFEALLRGKRVVVHGQPFYAGWGLTEDLAPIARRSRALEIDALVAGALILYPAYLSQQTGQRIEPEQAVQELEQARARRAAEGRVQRALRAPWRRALRWANAKRE
jgi:capsular polysaccharide export protein